MSKTLKASLVLLALVAGSVGLFRLTGSGDVDQSGFSIEFRDAQGGPAECVATLWLKTGGQRQASETASQNCVAGRVEWIPIEPGTYQLIAQSPGHERVEKSLNIGMKTVDFGSMDLRKGMRIEGLVELEGAPVADALILLEGGRRTTSNAEGRFVVDGLPREELELRAAAQAGRGALRVRPEDTVEDLHLVLTRGKGQGLLGLQFDLRAKGPVVTALLSGSEASEELERGDLLVEIDGVGVRELSKEEVAQVLAGEVGSTAFLKVERAGELREINLRRMDPLNLVESGSP